MCSMVVFRFQKIILKTKINDAKLWETVKIGIIIQLMAWNYKSCKYIIYILLLSFLYYSSFRTFD